MKRVNHFALGTLLIVLFLSLGVYSSGRAQPLPAQQLQGDAARQFLRQEGILAQLEAGPEAVLSEPPQGRSYLEPQPHAVANAEEGDQVGYSVSVDGDTLLVGAPYADVGDEEDAGAAYLFTREAEGAWSEQQKLVASDGAAGDNFGWSVALGEIAAIVGAHQADIDGNDDQGAAYVFTLSAAIWSEAQKLTAGDGAASDWFGYAVALVGGTALIGARYADIGANTDQGAAYVFANSGGTWSEGQKLVAGDGAAEDYFGGSVALDGSTALVAAERADIGGNDNQGAAYVFALSNDIWGEEQKLTAGDGAAEDYFGGSVALDGDSALVGAYQADIGLNMNQGAAYVFTRDSLVWSEQQQLTAGDGAAGDWFGAAVALEEDTAVVGAPNAALGVLDDAGLAHVFIRDGSAWSEQQTLLTAFFGAAGDNFGMSVALDGNVVAIGAPGSDSDATMDAGKVYMTERGPIPWPETSVNAPEEWESAEGFGLSVALDEDTALVGAPSAEPGAIPDQGAAYVFTRSGSSWSEQQTLSAGDGAAEDDFGAAVAVDGSTAIVGATGAGDNGQGAAYVFTFDGASWTEQQQLTAGDGAPGDGFGGALALDGATLIVGASWAGDIGQGAAYVFTFNGASWSELQMLTAGDGAVDDYFGASVALDGDTAVVGAAGANVGDNDDQGAAYVFYRDGGVVWSEQQKLTAGDGTEDDEFGSSVALAGDTAIILAHSPEDPDIANVWAAYVFTRDGDGEWSEVQKLMAGDAGRADGANVAMSGGTAIVGVPLAVVGTNVPQGAAYIFRQGDAGWSWEQKLLAGNGAPGAGETYDLFGSAVALDGNTALVGAPGYTDVPLPNERARVHFFERTVGGYHTYLPVALNQ